MNDLFNNIEEGVSTSQRSGIIATLIYIVVVGLSLWLTQCKSSDEEILNSSSGSLLIALGDSPDGAGVTRQAVRTPAPAAPATPKVEEVQQPTDESSEVELVQPKTKVEEVVEPKPEQGKVESESEVKPREVNQKALFPGSSNSTQSASSGQTTGASVAGSERGTPDADTSLGEGLSGDFSLAGRSLVGSLPVPSYTTQSEGRVVISITVDELGRVTSANYSVAGSTTNDSRLVSSARTAALKARFTPSDSFLQSGTITYIFKMR